MFLICRFKESGRRLRVRSTSSESDIPVIKSDKGFPSYAQSRDQYVEERKDLTCDLHEQPHNHRVRNRNLVNIAPFQLGEKVIRVHSARLDEVLVTAAILPGCTRLEKHMQRLKQALKTPSLSRR